MNGTRENLTGRTVRIEAGKDIRPYMAMVYDTETGETIDNVVRAEIDLDINSKVNKVRLYLFAGEQGSAEQVNVDVACAVLAHVERVEVTGTIATRQTE